MSEVIASADPTPTIEIEAKNPALTRRTAVLVVHGIGSQRALDTVRGIVAAAWLDKDDKPGPGDKRYWLHPERKSDDLDLAVITTNEVPGTPSRFTATKSPSSGTPTPRDDAVKGPAWKT